MCEFDRSWRATAIYRLRQFRRALGAKPTRAQLDAVQVQLTTPQWRLFCAMSPRDQWHAIQTLRLLRARGAVHADLALAALLHDAGKGYIRLHERVLYVLLTRRPRLLQRLATAQGAGWRTALFRSARHAEAGARLAQEAGASDRVVELIRGHHRAVANDAELAALIDADARA
jgi:hypothetical protein